MKKHNVTPLLMSILLCSSSVGVPINAEETDVQVVSDEQVANDTQEENVQETDSTETVAEDSEATETTGQAEEVTNNEESAPEEIVEENTEETSTEEATGTQIPEAITVDGEESETSTTGKDIDNDALYDEYLNSILYNKTTNEVELYQDDTGKTTLSDSNYKVYQYLREYFAKVASGEETSTTFNVDFASLGIQTTFTKEELGVDSIVENGKFTSEASAAFKTKVSGLFNLDSTVMCLLQDAPYDMYWYDKTKGSGWTYSYTASAEWNDETESWDYTSMRLTTVKMSFYVAPGYNADTNYLTTKTDGINAAKKSAENAQAIVDKYVDKSDYEKVVAYKTEIMDLVSYDSAAASAGSISAYGSGDPWQLIWVFDGDDSTNVVCEGYSKAFQYLCELSSFNTDIYCYTVGGTMGGGGHMWNVIRMDDGNYYLVDITNSDTGTVGQNGGLFLNGAASGSVDDGYVMYCNGANISYVYNDKTKANNLESTLAISMTDYQESSVKENHISFDWNYANSGFMSDLTFEPDKVNTIPSNTYKRDGYVFTGWNTAMDGSGTSYKDGASITGLIDTRNEDVKLYAQWEEDTTYKVSFDWNYANSGSMPVLTGYTNGKLTLPENNFVRDGYTFIGWNTKMDGNGKSYKDEATLTGLDEDIVLYAQWEKNPSLTISFDWNYGNSGSMPTVNVEKGKSVTLPENTFTKDGYVFDGWNTAIDGNGADIGSNITDFYKALNGKDTVLYAQWKKDASYTITYDWNYANSGDMPVTIGYEHKGAVVAENSFVKEGYKFVGWNTSMDGNGTNYKPGDVMPEGKTEDTVLYAQWEAVEE